MNWISQKVIQIISEINSNLLMKNWETSNTLHHNSSKLMHTGNAILTQCIRLGLATTLKIHIMSMKQKKNLHLLKHLLGVSQSNSNSRHEQTKTHTTYLILSFKIIRTQKNKYCQLSAKRGRWMSVLQISLLILDSDRQQHVQNTKKICTIRNWKSSNLLWWTYRWTKGSCRQSSIRYQKMRKRLRRDGDGKSSIERFRS